MICEYCKIAHTEKFGSGRFCCMKCARAFSAKINPNRAKSISLAKTGMKLSESHKLNISKGCEGRINYWTTPGCFTATQCKQRSDSMKNYYANPDPEVEQRRKTKLSEAAKRNHFGGHTSKLRKDFVKNDGEIIHLHSSYETKYATLLEQKNIRWSRPDPLTWIDELDKPHRYYPDFYLIDVDIYVDTKNDYLIVKDQNKIQRVIEQNGVLVKVLSVRELDWLPDFGPQALK